MRLYLSGPITGIPDGNPQFEVVARQLRDAGHDVCNPKDVKPCPDSACAIGSESVSEGRYGEHSWECYLRHDLVAMLHCEGVALLDGWHQSRGARLELRLADGLKMPVRMWSLWIPGRGQA